MSNPAFKPSEGKREEFRKYLEKNGVMDALTKVLVSLYEEVEKPEDALEFIRDKLAIQAGVETLSQMKAKQEELQQKIDQLEQEMEQLKISLEPPSDQPLDGDNPPLEPQGSGPLPNPEDGPGPDEPPVTPAEGEAPQ